MRRPVTLVVVVFAGGITSCSDSGVLHAPTDGFLADDVRHDTDHSATDMGTPVERQTCTPRVTAWVAQNEPAIAYLAGGGIAWHPLTGLRTWGGHAPVGGDTGVHRATVGFAWEPWDIPAERWRKTFHTPESPCMARADGTVGCRDPDPAMPERAVAIEPMPYTLCWMDEAGAPGCTSPGIRKLWPSAHALPPDLVDIVAGGAHTRPSSTPYVCALDARGRAWCDGHSIIEPFADPGRCWVELAARSASLCGIDHTGAVLCQSASTYEYRVTDDVPQRGDLSHLAVSLLGACALDPEGHIVCWGLPDDVLDLVSDDAGFVDVVIDPGGAVCALDAVGRVECWGVGPMANEQPDRPR